MESRAINDTQITASSLWHEHLAPERARLNIKVNGINLPAGAWSAKYNNANQWLQVDLGMVTIVTGIATQGRQDYNQCVKSYSLQYSMNDNHFIDYEGGKIFTGNTNQNSIVKHALKPAIIARYIRVRPKTWHGHISMRMELYGCKI
jgi:hypothetical protein